MIIAFDTDVLTEILLGTPAFVARVSTIGPANQAIPVIVVEELVRGRLSAIRQAEAGKPKWNIEQAYELFEMTLQDVRRYRILPYTTQAHSLFEGWRQQKLRVATHDLRIAAICMAHSATLVSRNRKDYQRIPELSVDYWN
jgi:tRNA(fMet)-specific endonuclease VapC